MEQEHEANDGNFEQQVEDETKKGWVMINGYKWAKMGRTLNMGCLCSKMV